MSSLHTVEMPKFVKCLLLGLALAGMLLQFPVLAEVPPAKQWGVHANEVEVVNKMNATLAPDTGSGKSVIKFQPFGANNKMSADGRYITFESNAPDLIPGECR